MFRAGDSLSGAGRGDRSRVAVVTDSAASLPEGEAASLGIRVVPMGLVVGGVVYADDQIDPDDLLARSANERVTTSAPSPGDFAKGIAAADAEDGALIVTVSGAMSASLNSARLATHMFRPGSVQVLDSGTAAGAQGLVALAAAEVASLGADLTEVSGAAHRVASQVRLAAALERLDHLARSGRVPSLAALAGGSLGLRLLFEFVGGRVKPRRPARGNSAALGRIVEGIRGGCPGTAAVLRVVVMHAQAPDQAHLLAELIASEHPGSKIVRAPFSSVMVAHTGPGLVGAAWWWDQTGRAGDLVTPVKEGCRW